MSCTRASRSAPRYPFLPKPVLSRLYSVESRRCGLRNRAIARRLCWSEINKASVPLQAFVNLGMHPWIDGISGIIGNVESFRRQFPISRFQMFHKLQIVPMGRDRVAREIRFGHINEVLNLFLGHVVERFDKLILDFRVVRLFLLLRTLVFFGNMFVGRLFPHIRLPEFFKKGLTERMFPIPAGMVDTIYAVIVLDEPVGAARMLSGQ